MSTPKKITAKTMYDFAKPEAEKPKSKWKLYVQIFPSADDVEHISDKAIRLKSQCGIDIVLPKSQILIDDNNELLIPMWLLKDIESSPCIFACKKFWLNTETGEFKEKKDATKP